MLKKCSIYEIVATAMALAQSYLHCHKPSESEQIQLLTDH